MRPSRSLTDIRLDGGVQSSVMALMASDAAFGTMPDWRRSSQTTTMEPPYIYADQDMAR